MVRRVRNRASVVWAMRRRALGNCRYLRSWAGWLTLAVDLAGAILWEQSSDWRFVPRTGGGLPVPGPAGPVWPGGDCPPYG